MLAQTIINPASSRRTAVHVAQYTSPENVCTLRPSADDRAPVSCLVCEMPMTLVRIKPKVLSFSEVNTFRCFACGDVCRMELKKAA